MQTIAYLDTHEIIPEAKKMRSGIFHRRLNRFVVECEVSGRTCRAHLANPGRLWELLLPGRKVCLLPQQPDKATEFTLLSVERDGRQVFLHTHLTNRVAGHLLAKRLITSWEEARIVKREPTVGSSRFDFLMEQQGQDLFLEVKSCTLFGREIAMFPDAPSLRGTRQLKALSQLADKGATAAVLFLVHSPQVKYFLPDYHTDITFARELLFLREKLKIRVLSLPWQHDLSLAGEVKELVIPWEIVAGEAQNGGSYLCLLKLAAGEKITVGGLGPVEFLPGYYVYVGSSKKNLHERMARHLVKKKNLHWHIDYLRNYAVSCTTIPVRTQDRLEHEIAAALNQIFSGHIEGFGASDCNCPTHLFWSEDNPLHREDFIKILQYFRIDRLKPI